MVIFHDITKKELEKIERTLRFYITYLEERGRTAFHLRKTLSKFPLRNIYYKNPSIENLQQKEFQDIVIIMDMACCVFIKPYDNELDRISTKLQKSYYLNYKKKVFKQ